MYGLRETVGFAAAEHMRADVEHMVDRGQIRM